MVNKISDFLYPHLMAKPIVKQVKMMEKTIPGTLFGKAKPELQKQVGLQKLNYPMQPCDFLQAKNKLGA